ncbi:M24 family metallopeptidase [Desulfurivibrio alkaliphilus]|uniref:Peptidase M24 n=1 Tax=Desulfurivibrio alkaliphilus (strain DSM 19089 / UNIQEM U267 / AHT2) TaxID=589865 RepID=D6Z4X0_DESAT|nr:Xaa-Pro peptidase family protein [Desulfurivibrio alkaliphilus]ADH86595.1 peptidase M24 [Desulfurivibrio alkaliphilus AHT 2]
MTFTTERLTRLRRRLQRRGLDAMLVTQPENRRYLSGFTATDHGINESSGVLLIPAAGRPLLLTDGRYRLQAEEEAPDFEVLVYPRGLFPLLRRLFNTLKPRRLAFESHYLLHSVYGRLAKLAADKGVELVAFTELVEEQRLVKSSAELELIEEAVRLNEKVFAQAYRQLRPGISEQETAWLIEDTMRRSGAQGPSFPTIVAAGPNGAKPHAVPTARKIKAGEPVIIDMGLQIEGYCSDMTRTVVLGEPDDKTLGLLRLVRRAQLAGQEALRAGVSGRHVDQMARRVIAGAGYGDYFDHSLGHGVGLNVHEGPTLSYRNRKKLRPGMVVTIEPGVYLPGWGGVRLENMAVVTPEGCRILNQDTTFLNV